MLEDPSDNRVLQIVASRETSGELRTTDPSEQPNRVSENNVGNRIPVQIRMSIRTKALIWEALRDISKLIGAE